MAQRRRVLLVVACALLWSTLVCVSGGATTGSDAIDRLNRLACLLRELGWDEALAQLQESNAGALNPEDPGSCRPSDSRHSLLLQIGSLAEYPTTESFVLEVLKEASDGSAGDLFIADAYLHALMRAGRLEAAVEAAPRIWTAYCGEEGAECESSDDHFVRSLVLLDQADALATKARFFGPRTSLEQKARSLYHEAIELSDGLDPAYESPSVFRSSFRRVPPIHPSLRARGAYAVFLLEAGFEDEGLNVIGDVEERCPRYHDTAVCARIPADASDVMTWLGIERD